MTLKEAIEADRKKRYAQVQRSALTWQDYERLTDDNYWESVIKNQWRFSDKTTEGN